MKLAALLAVAILLATPACGHASLYSETLEPANARGTVLVIHGGGWQWVGPQYVQNIQPEAARFASYGWRTVNVDYTAGRASLRDIRGWYDRVRSLYPGPVCAFGESAGAHLALMLAHARSVDCVIGHAAITDLRTIRGSKDAKLIREKFVPPSFGDKLTEYSPVAHTARTGVRVLLANSQRDTIAPCRQLAAYKRAQPDARTVCVAGGRAPFIHAGVDAAALERLHIAERRLLAQVAGL